MNDKKIQWKNTDNNNTHTHVHKYKKPNYGNKKLITWKLTSIYDSTLYTEISAEWIAIQSIFFSIVINKKKLLKNAITTTTKLFLWMGKYCFLPQIPQKHTCTFQLTIHIILKVRSNFGYPQRLYIKIKMNTFPCANEYQLNKNKSVNMRTHFILCWRLWFDLT